ncbi:PREDICTED: collectin-11-like [Branchiostoma belcheri]|uniref:Collectin-11-like n=1 Tax=Branchiostoma belcheri TaxID=7741 RepID=A0A6P5AYC2_BRABE|nr:PREDICTED: collectin-11-like [Branchiostoma belcheri]
MQEQIKELQKQVMDLPDLKNKVKNLTANLCVIKQACCNKTLAVCPCGYERFSETPGMCYKFSTKSDMKTYADARSTCQADGGHLAMPKDKATNDFLAKQIRARDYIFDHAWFGLTDQVQERTWVWEDGTPLGTGWNNWAQGPPVAYPFYLQLHDSVNCALLAFSSEWFNHQCTASLNYICEVKATAG